MNQTVGRACPQRVELDVFHARQAARRDGLALPGSWGESMVTRPRRLRMNQTVGRACPQRAGLDVFHARQAARRDGLALPGSWGESMVTRPRQASHEPDGRASLSPASRSGRVPRTSSSSPGRTRSTGFMGRVHGSETKETSHELPWVKPTRRNQPQRGCASPIGQRRNPVGVEPVFPLFPRLRFTFYACT